MLRRCSTLVSAATPVCALSAAPGAAAGPPGTWTWPVVGPVIRAFDPPASPYGSGHRGIDIATGTGSVVVAPASGTVSFAGAVGGHLFLTIAHGGGVSSTYSWLGGLTARRGDVVAAGDPIAVSGSGDPRAAAANLHLGVKLDGAYVDPLAYLGPLDLTTIVRLAPLQPA